MTRADRMFWTELGIRVAAVRSARRLSQAALAKRIGLSRASANNIECGRQRIHVSRLVRIANVLRVPVSRLIPTRYDR